MTKAYKLTSSAAVHTPGIIAWAKNGYSFADDREKLRNLIVKTYRLPRQTAHKLLNGDVEYKVEGDAVVFEVEEDE